MIETAALLVVLCAPAADLTQQQLDNIRARIEATARWRETAKSGADDPKCAALFAGSIAYGGGEDNVPAGSLRRLREVAAAHTVFIGTVAGIRVRMHEGQPFSVIERFNPAAPRSPHSSSSTSPSGR